MRYNGYEFKREIELTSLSSALKDLNVDLENFIDDLFESEYLSYFMIDDVLSLQGLFVSYHGVGDEKEEEVEEYEDGERDF
jgi:hypothetical protein